MIPTHALVNMLVQHDIHFLVDYEAEQHTTAVYSNSEFLIALASQKDARLRLALIPVFLSSRELTAHITDALEISADATSLTLKVYYTAAFLLSKIYADEFLSAGKDTAHLGDRFSKELTLSRVTDNERLEEVAAVYEKATGLKVNWSGSFHHAATRVIKRSMKELTWAKS